MCPPLPCIENGKNWTVRCIHEQSCQQYALMISATASGLSIITFSFAALLVLLNLFYHHWYKPWDTVTTVYMN